eukprot:1150113-Pelagomonas_calceolata.AAC.10
MEKLGGSLRICKPVLGAWQGSYGRRYERGADWMELDKEGEQSCLTDRLTPAYFLKLTTGLPGSGR